MAPSSPLPTEQQQQQQQQIQAQQRKRPQWREAVAGACAGAVSRTLLAPVERVKLLKQLQGSVVVVDPAVAAAGSSLLNNPSMSAWQVARTVYREQGVLSFWRGNIPSMLRVSGTAAINFTCMDYYKRAAVGPLLDRTMLTERHQKLVTSFVAGGMAGATATTTLYPIEFIRTRLAMDVGGNKDAGKPRQYTGMMDVTRQILKSDGITGLFQGYGIAVTGGIFYRIVLLGGYDALKGELLLRKQTNGDPKDAASAELSWGERILSAQFISLTAGTLSYPFDSVRRRLMMQAGVPREQRKFRNSIHCIRHVFANEGLRGFYLGLGPNLVRSVSGALLLVGYDRIRTLL